MTIITEAVPAGSQSEGGVGSSGQSEGFNEEAEQGEEQLEGDLEEEWWVGAQVCLPYIAMNASVWMQKLTFLFEH